MQYFSSDWHLGHANIIKYDKRPFKNVSHMDDTIITEHNNIVTEADDFYFLGDFCMGDTSNIETYLARVRGKKYFIKGNHDKKATIDLYKKYGTYLGSLAEIDVDGTSIVLCHYAMRVWNKSHRGSYHLYGHSHGSLPEDPNSLSFDVGVNSWDYKPISFEQIGAKMKTKTFKPIDHHGAKHFKKP